MKLAGLDLKRTSDEQLFGGGLITRILAEGYTCGDGDQRFSHGLLKALGGDPRGPAGIATVLVPLLERANHKQLEVVGNDGPNLCCGESYPWLKYLEDALYEGTKVTYILMRASEESREKLLKLHISYPDRFQALEPKQDLPEDALARFKEWETFHFVIASDSDALWLENFHPPQATKAQDCWFFETASPVRDELKDRLGAARPFLKNMFVC